MEYTISTCYICTVLELLTLVFKSLTLLTVDSGVVNSRFLDFSFQIPSSCHYVNSNSKSAVEKAEYLYLAEYSYSVKY